MGPTFITFRIDAIGPTANPSIDDGVSSLSVRDRVLNGFIIDEHFGMGFLWTWHEAGLLPGSWTQLVYTLRELFGFSAPPLVLR